MSREKTSNMVEAHAEGEVGRMITGGVLDPPGRTTLDKMNHLNNVDDSLRRIIGSRFGVLFEGVTRVAGRP